MFRTITKIWAMPVERSANWTRLSRTIERRCGSNQTARTASSALRILFMNEGNQGPQSNVTKKLYSNTRAGRTPTMACQRR